MAALRPRFLIPLLLVFTLGCASAPAAPPARHRRVAGAPSPTSTIDGAETAGGEQSGADPALAAVSGPVGSLEILRSDLIPTLDAGFGRFLGTVRVSAVLEHGRFVGFRIDAFRDATGRYAHADLAPGDVVVRINGSAIERPEQALAVWNALRVTSELCVEYLRNGQRREIRYAIVD